MTTEDLREAIVRTGMGEGEAMDAMQEEAWPRVVSDLCVRVEEVAIEDVGRAVKWLDEKWLPF